MAARKKTTTRKKPQYVRAKKRKGADTALVAQRSTVIVVGVCIIIALLVGIVMSMRWANQQLFAKNSRFELQHLIISTDGRLKEDYLRERAGVSEGTNLFAFSFADLQKELESVSQIESVSLRRKLPDTLIIKVKERVPVAQIIGRRVMSAPWMVDREGVVLPHRRKLASLPVIKGLDMELQLGKKVEHSDVDIALKIISMVDASSFLKTYIQLDSIDVRYPDYIYLYLRNGLRAKMPRYSLDSRLHKLAGTIQVEAGKGKRLKTLDLTLDTPSAPGTYY